MKIFTFTATAFVLSFVLLGCGVKPTISPLSPADTPGSNYAHGIISLQAGEFQKALRSFQRAKALHPKFAPAFEGIALVHLELRELHLAEENFKESIGKDRNYAPAHVGLGRVFLANDRHGAARRKFDDALNIDEKNVDAHYRKGEAYFAEGKFSKARKWFRKTLDLDNSHVAADEDWNRADRIERAMPGTKWGKELALKDSISRADLSLLLMEELKLHRRLPGISSAEIPQSSQNPPTSSDIDGHYAEQYIRQAIKLGFMGLKANGKFAPDEIVNRRDFALVVQGILRTFVGKSATRFIGTLTAFPDLPSSNFAYSAALLATTRGILVADASSGNFRPLDSISGADALIGLRKMLTLETRP